MSSYAKKFEKIIKECFLQVPNTLTEKLPDQQSGYFGSTNVADIMVYHHPCLFYIECKTVAKINTWNFSGLTFDQLNGMLLNSKIHGITCGVTIWFVAEGITIFVEINEIKGLIDSGVKSINVKKLELVKHFKLKAIRKQVYFDYSGEYFLSELMNLNRDYNKNFSI